MMIGVAELRAVFVGRHAVARDRGPDFHPLRAGRHRDLKGRIVVVVGLVQSVAALEVVNTGDLNMTATAGDPGGWKYDTKTGKIIVNIAAYQTR